MRNKTKLYKLRRIRRELGVKQEQIAEVLGCTSQFYSQIERGVNTLTYANAVRIADFFQCRPDDLFLDDFKWAKRKRNFE